MCIDSQPIQYRRLSTHPNPSLIIEKGQQMKDCRGCATKPAKGRMGFAEADRQLFRFGGISTHPNPSLIIEKGKQMNDRSGCATKPTSQILFGWGEYVLIVSLFSIVIYLLIPTLL